MAQFEPAVDITLKHEGGYVDNPADRGGPTNMGITQKDMPGFDMKTLTVPMAIQYYRNGYWKPYYGDIIDQNITNKLFDSGVLFGVGSAVKVLQTVLKLTADGIFGPVTLNQVNSYDPTSLMQAYKTGLLSHVLGILSASPQDRQFSAGWINRLNS